MSSTSPSPLPSVESLTRYVDALHQQQQQVISKLTLAQQAATRPAMKAAPTATKSVEALQARVTDQLTGTQAIIQKVSQTLGEALASGNAGIITGAGTMTAAALQHQANQLDASRQELQAYLTMLQQYVQFQQEQVKEIIQQLESATKTVMGLLDSYTQTTQRIASNISR
jgi:Secretion system effector C (SseC) like family